MPKFQLNAGVVEFDLESMEDVISTIEANNLNIDNITVTKIISEDITSFVKNLVKPKEAQEKLRKKMRDEYNLSQFDSAFLENDWELPYEFDLLFDIKSEGHIAYKLSNDGFIDDELEEFALQYGLSIEYLDGLLYAD